MNNTTTLKNSTIKKTVTKSTINNTKTVKKQKTILPDPQIWRNGVNEGDYNTIQDAVSNAQSGDTLILQPGTYQESNIPINTDLTIIGENQTTTIIDAQGNGNIFTIAQGITVNLEYITLTNGNAPNGGAINNDGTLNIINSTFNSNSASNGDGGAIFNEGSLTETNTTFNNNIGSWGGAIYNYNECITNNINCTFNNNNANNGGSITNHGNLTETNSTYTGNNADDGGAIYNFNTLTETNSTFNQNYSNQDDGIILNGGGNSTTPVSITNCNFTNNNGEAIVNGGYLTINNSTFTNNTASQGGAIYNNGILTILITNFTNNTADYGGAIYNYRILTVTESNFTSNQAIDDTNGGAIWSNGSLTNTYNIYTNNTAKEGGAIDNEGTLTDNNNNYYDNTASDCGGAIYNAAGCTLTETNSIFNNNNAYNNGGAIYNDGSATVNFNRIVNNDASTGTQIYNDQDGTIDATLNWWGTNNPNTNQNDIIGASYNPWIILTITTNPTIILTGNTLTITADLTHDNDGTYYNPVNGVIPYTELVNFTSTLGTINNAYMNNGIATTTLNTNNKPGTATVTATIDQATVKTSVYTPKSDIYVQNYPWWYNDDISSFQYEYMVGNAPVFTADIWNLGPDDATGVVVNYNLGSGLEYEGYSADEGNATYNNITNQLTWNIGSIPVYGDDVLKVFVRVIQSGNQTPNLTGTAQLIHVDQYDPDTTHSSAACKLIAPTAVDVAVNQSYITYTSNGSEYVTYTINTTNKGPDTATGVSIYDQLPAGLTYDSSNASTGTYNSTTGIWSIGNLNDNETETLTIIAKVTGTGTIINTAGLNTEDQYDWNNDDKSQNTIYNVSGSYTPKSDIYVQNYPWWYNDDISSFQYEYMVGNAPVFTADIWNLGPDDATGVVVNYNLGSGLEYEGYSADEGNATYNNITNQLTWNIGSIPVYGDDVLKVFVRVIQSGNQTPNLTGTAQLIHVDQYDPDTTHSSAACKLIAPTAVDVAVNQSYITYTSNGSEYVTYTINTTNKGPDTATGVSIYDQLPAGLTYDSSNASTGTYNSTTGIWSIGNLNDNETETLTIIAKVTGTGTIINTAGLNTEDQYDWNNDDKSQNTNLITTLS